ncbi:hypothetical protein GZH47_25550 [Paenibacillus rhizovicinus]|uniref:Uncharacterized protein n=1 Tax=Paenibacillus rhizovicinus TaxID=2704463 RepID=A0A6C0P5N8_9BACL|nr:hypothetical protein [Paenibacillus rhizovicinus]QHW33829.1 hypothetical protein GZH47_25550 [Paenibacillus rhizovicinus]
MYRKLLACSILCLSLMSWSIQTTYAAVPTLISDHWSVSLDAPDSDNPNMSTPVPNKVNMYSLKLKNTGGQAYHVRVQAFRDEPGSHTQMQLAVNGIVAPVWESGRELTVHHNLPVLAKANDIEVVVYWETAEDQDKIVHGKKAARTWKQSFHFKQKALRR